MWDCDVTLIWKDVQIQEFVHTKKQENGHAIQLRNCTLICKSACSSYCPRSIDQSAFFCKKALVSPSPAHSGVAALPSLTSARHTHHPRIGTPSPFVSGTWTRGEQPFFSRNLTLVSCSSGCGHPYTSTRHPIHRDIGCDNIQTSPS